MARPARRCSHWRSAEETTTSVRAMALRRDRARGGKRAERIFRGQQVEPFAPVGSGQVHRLAGVARAVEAALQLFETAPDPRFDRA